MGYLGPTELFQLLQSSAPHSDSNSLGLEWSSFLQFPTRLDPRGKMRGKSPSCGAVTHWGRLGSPLPLGRGPWWREPLQTLLLSTRQPSWGPHCWFTWGLGLCPASGCLGSRCLLEQMESRQIRDLPASLSVGAVGNLRAPIAPILIGPRTLLTVVSSPCRIPRLGRGRVAFASKT